VWALAKDAMSQQFTPGFQTQSNHPSTMADTEDAGGPSVSEPLDLVRLSLDEKVTVTVVGL
jgi:16S rRNA C1402 (ribose-2'-O) methylase RsmI